jgi:DNA mismatch repair ATPase MutS
MNAKFEIASKYVMQSVPKTLVLLDELGATSAPSKSLPYMWALAEAFLAEEKTVTLLVTHNSWVRHLSNVYPCTAGWTTNKFKLYTGD